MPNDRVLVLCSGESCMAMGTGLSARVSADGTVCIQCDPGQAPNTGHSACATCADHTVRNLSS